MSRTLLKPHSILQAGVAAFALAACEARDLTGPDVHLTFFPVDDVYVYLSPNSYARYTMPGATQFGPSERTTELLLDCQWEEYYATIPAEPYSTVVALGLPSVYKPVEDEIRSIYGTRHLPSSEILKEGGVLERVTQVTETIIFSTVVTVKRYDVEDGTPKLVATAEYEFRYRVIYRYPPHYEECHFQGVGG